MKTLKFRPELCIKILNREKTSTWRLFDDKDLEAGDRVTFLNNQTLEVIGEGTLVSVRTKTLGTLEDSDWEGHERFASEEEMYKTYREYYGEGADSGTELKIINFEFEAAQ